MVFRLFIEKHENKFPFAKNNQVKLDIKFSFIEQKAPLIAINML